MSNTTTTAYITAYTPVFVEAISPCVSFQALATAYGAEEGWRHAIDEIFASVASFMYWTVVQKVRASKGGLAAHKSFFQENKISCVEKDEYVENRIHSAAHKVIRRCCALNCAISRNGGRRFLTEAFPRSDEGAYHLADAMRLASTIAILYEKHTGKSICETRWID